MIAIYELLWFLNSPLNWVYQWLAKASWVCFVVILLVSSRVNTHQRSVVISTFSRLCSVELSHAFERRLLLSRGTTELTKVGTHHKGDLS